MAEITLPQLGETVTEGTIPRWFKKVGDTVRVTTKGSDSHEREELRGKDITVEYAITEAERITPRTTKELAEMFGVETEEIFREQDRSMTWVYWKITVTPRLEMLTRAHQLDAAQQNETRALLVLRRSKFMALFDSTPHLGIRLSGLAPLIERVAATAAAR